MKKNDTKAHVRLVRRGDEHPYVIEVTTPGWRGCEHAFDGTIKQTMPADLEEICGILKEANVRYSSPCEPDKEGVMLFMADGATEFVLRDATDFVATVMALLRAGWLSPEMPVNAPIN